MTSPTVIPGLNNPSYSENGAVTLLDSTITVTNDSSDFNGGSLTVRFTNGGIASDRLSILPDGGVTLDGRTVNVSGTTIGTYTGGIGSEELVISFNTNATPANIGILLQAIGYGNTDENLTNGSRTVEIILKDAQGDTSTPVSKIVTVSGVNDAPVIGQTTLLYDASLTTTPNTQGWTAFVPPGVTAAATNGVTNLDSSANAAFYAGYSRVSSQPLDAAQGFVVNFSAEVLSEVTETSANKNGDGKTDRAGFSIIVVSSDKTKAIELGFNKTLDGKLGIFAQEDGTSQTNPASAPNSPTGSPLTLFTQAESTLFMPLAGLNAYDLVVTGNTYTLYANGTAILSGKLRDYTAFAPTLPTPDPYETPNLIFFGDDTTSARANINLGSVKVTNNIGLTARTVNEDTALTLANLYVGDWDGSDVLTVTLSVAQGKLNITSAGGAVVANSGNNTVTLTGSQNQINQTLSQGNLTYQGNLNFNGSDTLTISATDGVIANPVTKTMAITVNSVYDAPTIAGTPTTSVDQDISYSFTPIFTNPDNAALTFNITNKPDWATFDPATGTLSGTPGNANVGSTNNIEISVNDGTNTVKLGEFNLTVSNVNDTPTSTDKAITTNEDIVYTFEPADFPFSDIDGGDSLQSVKITQFLGAGSLTLNGNVVNAGDEISIDDLNKGDLQFTPAKDANGQDYASLQFQVSDGSEYSSTQTLTVNVNAGNDAPTSTNQTVTTFEDTTYSFQLSDFPFNDVDGNSLQSVKITQLPSAGSLTLDGSAVDVGDIIRVDDIIANKLTFKPADNANGMGYASLQFQVSDGTEFSSTQTLTVNVTAVNDAPEISGVPKTSVRQGDNYVFTPTVTDIEGDSLSFSILNQPSWAEFDTTTGKLSGTPTNDNVGITQNIIMRVNDGLEIVELAPFNLSVDNVNDLPVISGQPGFTVSEDSFYSFTPVANDPDFGDQISFSIVNKPAWASFDPSTGKLSGTPTNEHVGISENIIIRVSDGQETVALAPFNLTVTNTNDAPILKRPLTDSTAKAGEDFSLTLGSDTFQDPDQGDQIRFSVTLAQGQSLPAWLKFDPQTQTFSGTPTNLDAEQLDLKVTATDSAGSQISDSFSLTVEAAPPTGIPTAPIQVQLSQMGLKRQRGTARADVLKGGWLKDDVLMGGKGNDVLISGQGRAKAGHDRLYGEGGNDRLYSGGGSDLLDGGTGNDRAWGGNGRDQILGGSGDDMLLGQNGNDILTGGMGQDQLSGGLGQDMFVFTNVNEGTDTITDFNVNQDVIDLRQIFAAPEFGGITDFNRFRQFIQLEQVGSSTAVKLDRDGNGSGQDFTTLAILQNTQVGQVEAQHFVIA